MTNSELESTRAIPTGDRCFNCNERIVMVPKLRSHHMVWMHEKDGERYKACRN